MFSLGKWITLRYRPRQKAQVLPEQQPEPEVAPVVQIAGPPASQASSFRRFRISPNTEALVTTTTSSKRYAATHPLTIALRAKQPFRKRVHWRRFKIVAKHQDVAIMGWTTHQAYRLGAPMPKPPRNEQEYAVLSVSGREDYQRYLIWAAHELNVARAKRLEPPLFHDIKPVVPYTP
jgi:hypothetical protein